MTQAIIHESQIVPMLLAPKNNDDYVWADSAFAGECFENLLSLGGLESRNHEKG